jgi:hypothetical protein
MSIFGFLRLEAAEVTREPSQCFPKGIGRVRTRWNNFPEYAMFAE